MSFDAVRNYLLTKPEALECFPFGPDIYVYKVQEKMFALLSSTKKTIGAQEQARINLKCDPYQAQELRDVFKGVSAGYHMNKTHWNTVDLNSDVPMSEIERQIDHSYGLIIKSLTRIKRQYLTTRYSNEELGI